MLKKLHRNVESGKSFTMNGLRVLNTGRAYDRNCNVLFEAICQPNDLDSIGQGAVSARQQHTTCSRAFWHARYGGPAVAVRRSPQCCSAQSAWSLSRLDATPDPKAGHPYGPSRIRLRRQTPSDVSDTLPLHRD